MDNLKLMRWRTYSEPLGTLVPIEDLSDLGMLIKRTFFVYGTPAGEVRGQHAHKATTQILTCIRGEISVLCYDGKQERSFVLKSPDQALKIPPGIWAEQRYEKADSILLVHCDTHFDEDDYIWDKLSI